MATTCTICLVTDQPLTHGGGRESAILDLSRVIERSGNKVKIVAPPSPPGRRLPTEATTNIQYTPFPVAYSHNLLRLRAVDVAIYNMHNLRECVDPALYRRQLLHVHDVEELDAWTPDTFKPDQPILANSRFVAQSVAVRTKIQPLIVYPIIERANYSTTLSPRFVTFVNPVPEKGVELAIAIAKACPQIPFQFVEGWRHSRTEPEELIGALAAVPNVRLRPWQADMRGIYSSTKILLVPSQWQEGFGRVIIEAQISGIPVMASSRGGCPEAVGDGGIVLAADAPAKDWAAVLESLWDDEANWAKFSKRATDNAKRHDAQQNAALERLLSLVRAAEPKAKGSSRQSRRFAASDAKCSVIVTHFNYAEFIKPLLDSLSMQTHTNFSCVIVDDCSRAEERDMLMAAVQEHGDERCRVLTLPENLGQIPAFFRGMSETDGDFISMIDPDDVYAPQFLEFMVRAHLNPERVAAVAVCEMGSFQIGGGPLLRFWSRERERDRVTGNIEGGEFRLANSGYSLYYPSSARGWMWGTTASFMFRREALEMIRPSAWTVEVRYDLDTYCADALHSLGGTLLVDRILSWRGRHERNIAFAANIFAHRQKRNKEGPFGLWEKVRPAALRELLAKMEPLDPAALQLASPSFSKLKAEQLWEFVRERPAVLELLIRERQQKQRLERPAK